MKRHASGLGCRGRRGVQVPPPAHRDAGGQDTASLLVQVKISGRDEGLCALGAGATLDGNQLTQEPLSMAATF